MCFHALLFLNRTTVTDLADPGFHEKRRAEHPGQQDLQHHAARSRIKISPIEREGLENGRENAAGHKHHHFSCSPIEERYRSCYHL